MTTFKQFEANRRNAQKSTGPRSEQGKQRSSQNAVRHGLTAETVIEPIEDADDYRAFEEAVTADYDAASAVERELVLRLASLLWRLRRAASIETSLLQIEGETLVELRQAHPQGKTTGVMAVVRLRRADNGHRPPAMPSDSERDDGKNDLCLGTSDNFVKRTSDNLAIARCFLRLAQLDNGVFERLGRYEMALWRQVRQTLFMLERSRGRSLHFHHRDRYLWSPRGEAGLD